MANNLEMAKKVNILNSLVEGMSIRGIERVTGVHRDTIMRLGVKVGMECQDFLNKTMVDLDCKYLQVDEIWGFVMKKQKRVKMTDPIEFGDVWTFVAIDSETKLIPCFKAGKRDAATANSFISDLSSRLKNRVQLSTDALKAYTEAVEKGFGGDVDYAQIVKTYTSDTSPSPEKKYSPAKITSVEKNPITGNPNPNMISTSYVERQNLTMRMHCRRLTRLTNAFSKKLENFEAALALHYAYYNFVKMHSTLRATPAMAAGITKKLWTMQELVEMVA